MYILAPRTAREIKDGIFDSSCTQRVEAKHRVKANEDILELGTEMDVKNTLI